MRERATVTSERWAVTPRAHGPAPPALLPRLEGLVCNSCRAPSPPGLLLEGLEPRALPPPYLPRGFPTESHREGIQHR